MIRLQNLTKIYAAGRINVTALDDINLEIQPGEFVVVRGPSGSGKTTLLMALAGMQRPSKGKVLIHQEDIYQLSLRERARFRARNIGFVFQMFHLVPYLTVAENIMLAGTCTQNGNAKINAEQLARELGISDRIQHRPGELSAGEKQRTAIARALFNQPKIILADEPTGNLDEENAKIVLEHLAHYQKQGGTIILVTHGTTAAEYADRIIELQKGKITPARPKKPD